MAALIGAALLVEGVLGLAGGGRRTGGSSRRLRVAVDLLWVVAGVVVLTFPGLTVRVVAVVVGVQLVLDGALRILEGLGKRKTLDGRISAVALGAAGITFGVLALAWPDITLLIVAVAFGAQLIIRGLLEVWAAISGRRRVRAPQGYAGVVSRWATTIAAAAAIILAVAAAAVSVTLQKGSPVVDDFYAAPRDVPAVPGRLVRAEPFRVAVPENAAAWRILYTTTRGDGTAAVASGLVVVPVAGAGDWPVIAWTHGTTGFAENCAPSLAGEPFESGALFVLPAIIDNGWALVATDYIGLGTQGPHPYLIGPDSGHAALDAVRAARQLGGAHLGTKTVVWGHSQGGGAALWAGAVASDYAPDVTVSGVAALAPASDLTGLMRNLPTVTGGNLFASFVFAAYAATYPDVTWRDYVRPGAETNVREMAQRCLAEPRILISLLQIKALNNDPGVFQKDPATGPLGERLIQNTPPAAIQAPLLLAQGGADQLVVPAAQDAYVRTLCQLGRQVDYRTYTGRDHVPLVQPDSPLIPDLIAWTGDRLAERPVQPGCSRSQR